MLNPIEPSHDCIIEAFFPKPIEFKLHGKLYLVEKVADGWKWRNEDGDTQEDFGISPFGTAAEAQQSAINHVALPLLQERRAALFEEMMAFENDQANLNLGSAKWHDTVQRMNDQIRQLDYEIKVAGMK